MLIDEKEPAFRSATVVWWAVIWRLISTCRLSVQSWQLVNSLALRSREFHPASRRSTPDAGILD